MKVDEALQLLQISRSADPDQVRRAYLRLIKKHKPDQDPEGFQRLREAYDLARQVTRFGIVQPVEEENEEEKEAENVEQDETEEDEPEQDEPESEDPILIRLKDSSGYIDSLSQILQRARSQAQDGSAKSAADLCQVLTDSAIKQNASWLAHSLLEIFFHLQARGEIEAAHRVFVDIERLITELGELAVLGGNATLYGWWLAQELDSLGERFPTEIRAAFTEQIITGESTAELGSQARHATRRHPHAALEQRLEERPYLNEIYQDLVMYPPPEDAPFREKLHYQWFFKLPEEFLTWNNENQVRLLILLVMILFNLRHCTGS